MNAQNYPLGLAIKGSGGRKTKQDRHIRTDRQRRRAFKAVSERLVRKFERDHGVHVDPGTFVEMAALDPSLARLGKELVDLRIKLLGR